MLTATQTNAYAIGPSFHDFDYERWSIKECARDAALESFAEGWKADLIADGRRQAFDKIDGTMESVFDGIYGDASKSDRFNRLIFELWAGDAESVKQISGMIQDEMDKVVSEEFEKGTDRH